MDFELSEEHRLFQRSVADALRSFEPRREELIRSIMKEKRFPQELWEAMARAGVQGCLVPEEYGGTGAGLLPLTLAVEQMGLHGLANALFVITAMDTACIVKNGSLELKRRFLPGIATGEYKFCFALTEPDAGSNAFRIQTHARRVGNSYRITGQKVFITGADISDYMLLVARTVPYAELKAQGLPKAYGMSVFVVDLQSRGITLHPIPTHGIEGMTQFTVHLDDVEVPAENLVGEEHGGAMVLFNSLNPERILAAAMAVGVSDYLLKKSVNYARSRCVFGDRPIATYQALQHPLAEIKIQTEAARLLTYRAAWAFDRDLPPAEVGMLANYAKFTAAETAIRACDQAIETHGGYGFSEEYGIIYFWESMRLLRTAPITKEMILNFVAEHVLELPKGY